MARRQFDAKSIFLAGAVETTEGTNPGTLTLIKTRGLDPTPYDGDTITREYDGDGGRNRPTVRVNEHTTFSFDVDFAGSGDPAIAPAVDQFLRMAGLSRVANATAGFDYLISDPADVESGTLLARETAGAGAAAGNTGYIPYEANGVRGYVGIQMNKDEDPLFQFRDMKGSYKRPEYVEEATIDMDYVDHTDPEPFSNNNTPTFQFGIPDGSGGYTMRDVCAHSFSASNYSGLSVTRSNAVNCAGSRVQTQPIEVSAQVGWDDDFIMLAESHQNIIRVPLLIQHGTSAGNTLTIRAQELQIHNWTRTALDDGTVGMDLTATFLDKPILTIA